jgi:hypothetical protein
MVVRVKKRRKKPNFQRDLENFFRQVSIEGHKYDALSFVVGRVAPLLPKGTEFRLEKQRDQITVRIDGVGTLFCQAIDSLQCREEVWQLMLDGLAYHKERLSWFRHFTLVRPLCCLTE